MSLRGQIDLLAARVRNEFNAVRGERRVKAASIGPMVIPAGSGWIDDVSVAVNDLVLLKDQASPSENGVYKVNGGVWTRAPGFNNSLRLSSSKVEVLQGVSNGGTHWETNFKQSDTVGTSPVYWYQTRVPQRDTVFLPAVQPPAGTLMEIPEWKALCSSSGSDWTLPNGVWVDDGFFVPSDPPNGSIHFNPDDGSLRFGDGTDWITAWDSIEVLHRCHVRRVATQPLTNGTSTTIAWDSEVEDTGGMWDPSNPAVVTIPESGRYLITLKGSSSATANVFMGQIINNGGAVTSGVVFRGPCTSFQPNVFTGSLVLSLSAGDQVSASLFVNSASVGTQTGAYGTDLMVTKLPSRSLNVQPVVKPACSIYKTLAQSAPADGSMVTVSMQSIRYDTDGMADLAGNRLVIQTAGTYRISGILAYIGNATGVRTAAVYLNNTEVAVGRYPAMSTGGVYGIAGEITLPLNVGDVITLRASQSSTVALPILVDTPYRTHLTAELVNY